jgi:hypothetical protein
MALGGAEYSVQSIQRAPHHLYPGLSCIAREDPREAAARSESTTQSNPSKETKVKELNQMEVNEISGGTTAGDIAMGLAGGWASTVIGFAIAGPVGGLIGFGVGAAITVGYALAQ